MSVLLWEFKDNALKECSFMAGPLKRIPSRIVSKFRHYILHAKRLKAHLYGECDKDNFLSTDLWTFPVKTHTD